MGLEISTALKTLDSFPGVPGRLEEVVHEGVRYYVDFAHSPDALEKTLSYLRKVADKKLIVLFGAPGNRDKGKRPKMGAAVHRFADIIIVTDDDPDTEDRQAIIDQVVQGIPRSEQDGLFIVPDREDAIARVVALAQEGDVVLLAGKGNESVQWTNKGHRPWSDKGILQASLEKLKAES